MVEFLFDLERKHLEADSSLSFRVRPHNFALDLQNSPGSRQRETKPGCASLVELARAFDGDAALADVGDAYRKLCAGIHNNGSGSPQQVAMVATALTHDQTVSSPHTAGNTVQGQRFVQNEVGSQFKGLLHRGASVDQSKSDAALVGLALAQLFEHPRAFLHVVAIHHDGVIFVARNSQASLLRVSANGNVNLVGLQYPAQCAVYFRVACEEESLQSHAPDVIRILLNGPVTNVTGVQGLRDKAPLAGRIPARDL